MLTSIDVKKSILKERVCFKSFQEKLNPTYLIVALPVYAAYFDVNHFSTLHKDLLGTVIGLLLAFGLPFILITNTYTMRKLLRLKDFERDNEEELIYSAAKQLNWTIKFKNADYMILEPPSKWGVESQATIIFDKKDLLINIVTFGRGNFISPVYMGRNSDYRNELISKLDELKFRHHTISPA